MQTITTKHELKSILKGRSKSLGFVPTMGALHAGHISLVETAKAQCQEVIASIFVNPTQFNNADDLIKYPRTVEADSRLLEEAGCDYLFLPSVEEMYSPNSFTGFSFGNLETVMEGSFRPGHFSGVGLVVSKLFHLVAPDKAFFGLKDLQQFRIIQAMAEDLDFGIEIVGCPTKRESSGLAMSSRNTRLSPEMRAEAPKIYALLQETLSKLPHTPFSELEKQGLAVLNAIPEVEAEYFQIVDWATLQPATSFQNNGKYAICMAAWFGEVRLIDNVISV